MSMPDDLAEPASLPAHRERTTERRSRRELPRQPADRAVYSAIDLGTNNCRLLIARPMRRGFRVIDAYSRIVRLGEGLTKSGQLSDAAMTRAIEALAVCAEKIRRRKVTCMRAVATEACRSATNREDFIARVRAETGLILDVIPPAEEARLAVAGCQTLFDPRYSHALVFDIGGGSTEIILVARQGHNRLRILGWTSLPFGVVSLAERHGIRDIGPAVYEEMVSGITSGLEAFEQTTGLRALMRRNRVQLLGTSGTVTTLASVALGLPHYDRNRVDGAWIDGAVMHSLARRVALMSHAERICLPCIGEERADYVVSGCAILDALFRMWDFGRLRVADRGIREGVLRGLMGEDSVSGPR